VDIFELRKRYLRMYSKLYIKRMKKNRKGMFGEKFSYSQRRRAEKRKKGKIKKKRKIQKWEN
jgi:hypothetical protein